MSPAQIGVAGGEASGFDGAGIAVLFDADVGLFQGGPIGLLEALAFTEKLGRFWRKTVGGDEEFGGINLGAEALEFGAALFILAAEFFVVGLQMGLLIAVDHAGHLFLELGNLGEEFIPFHFDAGKLIAHGISGPLVAGTGEALLEVGDLGFERRHTRGGILVLGDLGLKIVVIGLGIEESLIGSAQFGGAGGRGVDEASEGLGVAFDGFGKNGGILTIIATRSKAHAVVGRLDFLKLFFLGEEVLVVLTIVIFVELLIDDEEKKEKDDGAHHDPENQVLIGGRSRGGSGVGGRLRRLIFCHGREVVC